MAQEMSGVMHAAFDTLRYEPTSKRIRVTLAGETVAETDRARLVWEPRRIVPTYAVPLDALSAHLVAAGAESGAEEATRSTLDPTVPFTNHSCSGTEYDVVAGEETGAAAAFRPDDADLADYVVLDFAAFHWHEESEPLVSHPRDPFHRIDVLGSARHVRVEYEGRLLAESSRPLLLFETNLPMRCYLPPDDVTELRPSNTVSYCAYKGRASYYSLPDGSLPDGSLPDGPLDIAWTYRDPLHDGEPVRDHICFFDERVDVIVDGVRAERPVTQWSEHGV